MISLHWFRQWLGAVRLQVIIWANAYLDLCRLMALLGHDDNDQYFTWIMNALGLWYWYRHRAVFESHDDVIKWKHIPRYWPFVPGEFPTQRPVTRSFDVFFDLRLNKRLSKQWRDWWFETLSRPLWRHRNEIVLSGLNCVSWHFNLYCLTPVSHWACPKTLCELVWQHWNISIAFKNVF